MGMERKNHTRAFAVHVYFSVFQGSKYLGKKFSEVCLNHIPSNQKC